MHAHDRQLRRPGHVGLMGVAQVLVAVVVASASLAVAAPEASAQEPEPGAPEVTVTELQPLPGATDVDADDINDLGQVVGQSGDLPVLWEDGQPTPLPLADGQHPAAVHINDRGDVVVQYRWFEASRTRHGAYLWRGGDVTELGTPTEDVGVADLNESGQVLLGRTRDGMTSRGLWQDGVFTDMRLPAPPEGMTIRLADLSDEGHVIGEYGLTTGLGALPVWNGSGGLFIWHRGTFTRLTSFWARGRAVNRHGQVAGQDIFGGVVWSGGRATRLGFEPVDINDRGQVLGHSQSAVLWEGGRTTDLAPMSTYPYAINERGQALGHSTTADDGDHTLLWTGGRAVDLGRGEGVTPWFDLQYELNDAGQALGIAYTAAGRRWVVWTVPDDGGPVEPPPDPQCVTATNQAHVQAGRATSWLTFAWAAGSGTYIGLTSQTTSLREAATGRWEPATTC